MNWPKRVAVMAATSERVNSMFGIFVDALTKGEAMQRMGCCTFPVGERGVRTGCNPATRQPGNQSRKSAY
jgi:nucleoid DNA-binding protein